LSTKLLSNLSSRSCALFNFFNFSISHVEIMNCHKNKKSQGRACRSQIKKTRFQSLHPSSLTKQHKNINKTDLRNWNIHYLSVPFFEFFITIKIEFIYISWEVELNKKMKAHQTFNFLVYSSLEKKCCFFLFPLQI